MKDSRRSQELVAMGVRRYCSFASHGFLLLLLLFLFLFLDASMAATTPSPKLDKSQIAIMMNLSSMVNPMGPSVTTKWNTSDSNPCLWRGITCSVPDSNSFSVVTGINLSGYDISNPSIFASICALDTLQVLDLSRNPFNNLADRSFFASSCSINKGLQSLNLSSSHLVSSLGNLPGFPRLEVLDLSFNSFSGNLSAGLSSFPKLRSLNLSSNKFEGDVPTSMVFSLEELVLSSNELSGSIPIGLFAYEHLTMLDLSQNNLIGDVPDEFGKLPKLQTLLLSGNNNLRGPIPGTLSMVTTLSRFAANQNNFNGSIPSGITKNVRMLDLSYNNLSGEIPSDFFFGSSLETVDLSINKLEGPIPGKFSPSLYRLRLGGNLLNGSIPESIGDAMNLSYLELDVNMLTGGIPSQLGACKNLALLNLASNRLEGSVPREISNLKNLEVLKLQMNNLNGSIPITISDFGNLAILNLSQNAFIGEIPAGLFQLKKLSNIDIQGNKISGTIPKLISSLQYLIELNLGNNNLTGGIPTMPNSLKTALNLSNNHLTGSIPSAIGTLSDLEILDLSLNDLSGQIPTSLSDLQSLTQLVLSYNHLSGSVPTFRQHVLVNITGNPDLTNGTGNNNNTPTSGKRKTHNVVIIFIAVAVALVGLCLFAAIVMVSLSKRIYRVEDEGPSAEEGVVQIINGHLITMNSVHTSAIDFVKAMEAVSSHNIFLKTRFCTYYKAVMPNGSTYSVKKLDWSDKIFQIGSQEIFGHELEVLGKLSNSNVMVPLAYMLTEDSAYLLYEHVYKGTVFDFLHGGRSDVLDWPTRYSIALGVAQGLTFLHGRTQPVLLLDLSTRTIHLKSMNEPQIGDIELYKIIDPSKSSGSLSTIAGTVGYIPPEYAYTMRLTMAGNVYSFGVILLELLTGKPSVNDGIELAKWALSLSATVDQRGQILDTRASGTSAVVHGQMMSVLNIALACVAFSPEARPKMRSVLRMLFNAK